MKRCWFQKADGTYFRNGPLIQREIEHVLRRPWLWHRHHGLEAEWWKVWREGVIRKDGLRRRDKVVQMRSFREAFPDEPALWVLDDVS